MILHTTHLVFWCDLPWQHNLFIVLNPVLDIAWATMRHTHNLVTWWDKNVLFSNKLSFNRPKQDFCTILRFHWEWVFRHKVGTTTTWSSIPQQNFIYDLILENYPGFSSYWLELSMCFLLFPCKHFGNIAPYTRIHILDRVTWNLSMGPLQTPNMRI